MPPRCSVAAARSQVEGRDLDVLDDTLALPEGHPERLTGDELATALRAEGLPGKAQMIDRHRRGVCSCATASEAA